MLKVIIINLLFIIPFLLGILISNPMSFGVLFEDNESKYINKEENFKRYRIMNKPDFKVSIYPVDLSSQVPDLGELKSKSQLNKPFKASIDIISLNIKKKEQLSVKLASPDTFRRIGIDRPYFLNSLNFSPIVDNGKAVILVTSDVPIKEPFLNFLIEVNWIKGRIVKEYTVLLDPPILMNVIERLERFKDKKEWVN